MNIDPKSESMQFTDEYKDRVYLWARQRQGNVTHAFENGKPVLKIPGIDDSVLTVKFGDTLQWDGTFLKIINGKVEL